MKKSSQTWDIPRTPAELAKLSLLIVASGLLLALVFNLVMAVLGFGYPYTSFLFVRGDKWADFFKLVFAYPGDPIHPPVLPVQAENVIARLSKEADLFRGTHINPDHLPPLPTLLALLARRAFALADPLIVFLTCLILAATSTVAALRRVTGELPGTWRWVVILFVSYPFWFMIDRGHFFSLICALTLIVGCWRMITTERMDWHAILLLAISCNLRPNVVILPALLVLSGRAGRLRDLVMLGFAGAVVLGLTMLAAHTLYPHYSPQSWQAGLADYHINYITRPLTSGYVSSFPSMVALLIGYQEPTGPLLMLVGVLCGGASLLAVRAGCMTTTQLMFIALAIMPIVTPAFSDYHLMAFLLPLLLLARDGRIGSRADWAVYLASIAMLIPKNYLFSSDEPWNPVSLQVFLNPIILLVTTIFLLDQAWQTWSHRQRQPDPAIEPPHSTKTGRSSTGGALLKR